MNQANRESRNQVCVLRNLEQKLDLNCPLLVAPALPLTSSTGDESKSVYHRGILWIEVPTVKVKRFTMAESVRTTASSRAVLPDALARLDGFVDHVRARAGDIADAFEAALLKTLRSETRAEIDIPSLEALPQDLTELQRANLACVLELHGRAENTTEVEFEIDRADVLRARLYPSYWRARCLRDVMGPGRAIPFLKDYVDSRVREQTEPDLSMEDIDRFWEDAIDPDAQSMTSGVAVRFHRGKGAYRIDRCLWSDVIAPFNDPEIAFLVCCYGDTANIEATNPNLAYTCPMTLIKGDPYCNKCLHDKRFVDAVEHPTREFYDSLAEVP